MVDVVFSAIMIKMSRLRGACGNVMHGLAALCHEAGNGVTMEGVALNKRAPYFYPTSTRFSYHQFTFRQVLINIGFRNISA